MFPRDQQTQNFHSQLTIPIGEKFHHHGQSTNRKTLLDKYCKSATCAGVNEWRQAGHWFPKTLWMTLLTLAIVVTSWQTIETLIDYINEQNRFQSVVSSELNSNASFPNLIVCNFNRINGTQAAESDVDPKVFTMAFCAFPIVYPLPLYDIYKIADMSKLQNLHFDAWNAYVGNGSDPDVLQLLMRYGFDCEKIFLRMMLGPEAIHPCERAKRTVNNFGLCYSFNLTDRHQLMPGSSMGMNMIINPALSDYLPNATLCNYLEEGIVLQIAYDTESWVLEPLAVSPGTHAFISLSVNVQKFLPGRYPVFRLPCRKDPKLKIMPGDYTKRMCYHDCILFTTILTCNCTPPVLPLRDDFPRCTMKETWECFMHYINNGVKAKELLFNPKYKECVSECLDSCDGTRQISASVTTAKFPLENAVPSFKAMFEHVHNVKYGSCHREDIEKCIKSFIALDIYFPTLTATTISTSEAQPLFAFIAAIGGQLGLWTGMCILTLVQALYYLVLCCFQRRSENRTPIQLLRPSYYWHQPYYNR